MNDQSGFDPYDYAVTQPLQRVVGTADDNPDEAARAVDLERSTGVPAPVIAANVPAFEQVHKQALATQILRSNPALIDYVRSHPLAAAVSNDDWPQLAEVAKSSTRFHSLLAMDPARGALAGAASDAAEGFLAKTKAQQSIDDWYFDKPLAWAVMSAAWFGPDAVLRGFNALMGAQAGAIRGGAETAYKAATGDEEGARIFGENSVQVANVLLAGSLAGTTEGSPALGEALLKGDPTSLTGEALRQREALTAAKPWLDSNLVPPRGVHPELDKALGDINAEGVNRLKQIVADSQSSSTLARSLEMFKLFSEQQHGDSTIGIHGPAVVALYGDKVPAPGDGLLGFVPKIGDQLLAAHISGTDVTVPMKDFVSQIRPEIAQQLWDDVRVFRGGITAREAQTPFEPRAMVDAPIAQVRGTSGLEPRFALGDRKLTLEPDLTMRDFEAFKQEYGAEDYNQAQFEDFTKNLKDQDRYWLTDSAGNRKGELHLSPDHESKELYIDHIIAGAGLWDAPNSLGPASVRDLLRQLIGPEGVYPGYTITGERVSGARDLSGGGIKQPQIRLSLDESGEKSTPSSLREVDDAWQRLSSNAWIKPLDTVDTVVHQELRRIVGSFPTLVPAKALHMGGEPIQSEGWTAKEHDKSWIIYNRDGLFVDTVDKSEYPDQRDAIQAVADRQWQEGKRVQGVFQPQFHHPPIVAWNVLNPEAEQLGIARHEAIHYLREYGFFTDAEWAELGWHALQQGWLDKYNIRKRYPHLDVEKQIEEAVAEGYRGWASGSEAVVEPTGLVAKAFRRMKDLWQAISDKLRDVFGRGIDVEDLLQSVHEGRIARRGPQREPTIAGVMEPKFSISEEDFQNLKANAIGLDAKSWKNLQDSLKARHESDLVAAVKRAEAQQRQEQTSDWKANLKLVRKEVERTIRQRPDVASDLFVNSGEYEGTKLNQRIPLRADDLTDEQKAALPSTYYAKTGLPVADVARLFGYQDGQHLIERLSAMAAQRGDRTPQAHLQSLIDGETQLRMERQHGKLEDNIMEAASDQALSDTDINLLIDEYVAAGMMAKQPTIDKNVLRAQAQDAFNKLPLAAVSSNRLKADMARHDRDAERSLIPGQVNEVVALKSIEQRVFAGLIAAEAAKAEKLMKQFDRTLDTLDKRQKDNLPQPHLNFIHQIMAQIGRPPTSRTPWDIKNEIAEHDAPNTLEGFVNELSSKLQPVEVWPELFNDKWHTPYMQLTVDEFRNVKDSIDSLYYIGREVKKVTDGTTKADLNSLIGKLTDSIRDFGVKHYDKNGQWMGPVPLAVATLPRTALAKSLALETVFGRMDHFDPFGPWTQYGLRPLIEADYAERGMDRDVNRKLRAIYDESGLDMNESVFNPLFRDMSGGDLLTFDRSNLLTVMLNTGSRGGKLSNLTYLAKGHGLEEKTILDWIDQHATKEDWDWCQKVWNLFKNELWAPAQQMRRSLSGTGAKSLNVPPIQTPFGEYAGGYYPIIKDGHRESVSSLLKGLEGDGYIRATTWDGYAHERTGEYAPLNLTLEPMTNRIGQIIHDIAMRPAILNAAKIFYHDDIYAAMKRHIGEEYADLLIPYLKDVANVTNRVPADPLVRFVNAAQKNVATSLIGFNLGTFLKHTPTAWATSMQEVGPERFLRAVSSLFSINEETGQSNWQFAKDNFEEIQNRDRNWIETLVGTKGEFVPGESLGLWRQKIAQWSAKPIALGDMASAVPLSLAAYWKAKEEGLSEGDAVFLANRAVRRAHGSSLITNRSAYQRELPTAVTYFYTFFNTMLNRQAEDVWKAGEEFGVTKQWSWPVAKAALIPTAGALFAHFVWPAIIEQMVSPMHFKPDDSKAKKLAMIAGKDLSSSWLVARDIANYIIEGRDPALGLYSTAFREISDVFKDAYTAGTQRQPMSKEQAGKLIRDSAGFLGLVSGAPLAAGKAGQFIYGTHVGTEHPRGPWGWAAGLRYGTLAGHSPTVDQWWEGR